MTKVIFRRKHWRDSHEDEILAFFPEAHVNPGNILCYAHMGQHFESSMDFYRSTKPCYSEKEYADLRRELETCCKYDDLKVVQKITRRDQARAWWPERFKETEPI